MNAHMHASAARHLIYTHALLTHGNNKRGPDTSFCVFAKYPFGNMVPDELAKFSAVNSKE